MGEVTLIDAPGLPVPRGAAAGEARERLVAALAVGDGAAVLRHLSRAREELSPGDRPLAVWLPCLVGCAERRAAGDGLPEEGAVARAVRDDARAELGRLPPDVRPLWVIPTSAADEALAVLTALMLSQRGRVARPWPWEPLPASAPYLTVGHRPHPLVQRTLHAGHLTLRPHDLFWDVAHLQDGDTDLRWLRSERSGRMRVWG